MGGEAQSPSMRPGAVVSLVVAKAVTILVSGEKTQWSWSPVVGGVLISSIYVRQILQGY